MDRIAFWRLIDDCRSAEKDIEELAAALTQRLTSLSPDDVIAFDMIMQELLFESYRWDIWAVAYIVNYGCSDDGFEYFRGWLIAQGKERWDIALKSPESIGNWTDCSVDGEEILSAPFYAYKQLTGEEMPPHSISQQLTQPTGESWEEDDLQSLYPNLWAKFN